MIKNNLQICEKNIAIVKKRCYYRVSENANEGGEIMKKTPKEIRLKNGYFQYFVAEKLGMCRSVYSMKERGKRKWTLQDAIKLSKFYKVSIDNIKL